MTDQLPPDIASLLSAEKAAAGCDAGSRAALRARIAHTVSGAAPAPPAGLEGANGAGGVGGALGTAKLLAALAVVVGIGAVAITVMSRGDDHDVPASASSPVTPIEHAAAPPKVEVVTPTPDRDPTPAPAPAPIPAPAPPPVVHAKPATAPSEASLLGQAWSSISSGNPRHALELAERDARLYPTGVMREERAAIEVVALAKLGRSTDAHVAAKQFLVRYPTSLHRALVEQSISAERP